jgi:hypothetical protein
MGIVGWFLSVHFLQLKSSSLVSFYLNQSGFASNLVESFFGETREASPLATPYCFGVPVDLIAPSTDKADSLAQTCWTQAYKSLIGSISWLAMTTRPDLTTIHSFLSSYSSKPTVGHMKLALYVLQYIHSTFDYDITFTSKVMAPMYSNIHYPPSTDVEAYTDAIWNHLQLKPSPLTAMHIGPSPSLQVLEYEWRHHFKERWSYLLAWWA